MDNIYKSTRPSIPADVERAVKIESGHRCAVSKCLEHTYLEIHHIDYNRENNNPSNLILLCGKHHKMAHAGIIDRKSLRLYKNKNSILSDSNPEPDTQEDNVSAIKIVDIYEVENFDFENSEPTITIELKLINRGIDVAFLKEIKITTIRHWKTITDRHHSLAPVSAEYDLNIEVEEGSISHAKIHHEIKSQETERIAFRLSTNYDSDPDALSLFLLKVEVFYDETSSVAAAPPIIINIPPRHVSNASFFPGYQKGTIPHNKAIASEVIRLASSGTIVSQGVLNALESWENAPEESDYFARIR